MNEVEIKSKIREFARILEEDKSSAYSPEKNKNKEYSKQIPKLQECLFRYPAETICTLGKLKTEIENLKDVLTFLWMGQPKEWKPYEDNFLKLAIPYLTETEKPIIVAQYLKINLQVVFKQLVRGEIFIGKIIRYAATDCPILIIGGSGTGKELIAKWIHYISSRFDKPFKDINSGGLPENLLESELFGYVKGAFTGADKDTEGLLQASHQGTLFLDEIGDMPLPMQVKLLRVLDSRTFYRVGDTEKLPLESRVICATNQDLESLIKEKKFREDLYHRINTVTIKLHPLRELLKEQTSFHLQASFFTEITRYIKNNHLPLTKGAITKLASHHYPGNYRELRNVLERAFIECHGNKITEDDIFFSRVSHIQEVDNKADVLNKSYKEFLNYLDNLKREYYIQLLRKHSGNVKKLCDTEIDTRRSVYNRITKEMKYLRIEPQDYRVRH